MQKFAGIAGVVVTVWPASAVAAGDAVAGKQKAQMCAVCHGLDGVARQPDAPNLAGESPIYLVRQLEAFRSGERQHAQMSIIAQGLNDADIEDLAAWYSSIRITVEMPDE
jgi:cytochrome c553